MTGEVRLECDGPVATVTLCRPDVLNAQTPTTWAALRDVSRNLPGDVRVVVVRGQGRSFSAGLDRAVLAPSARPDPPAGPDAGTRAAAASTGSATGRGASTGDSMADLVRLDPADCADRIAEFQAGFTWLRRPDLVTIAAVQGHAIGAGFQLALACDLRVLAEDAQLSMAEVTWGLVPDLGGTKRLVELVGYARAVELCVTGRRVPAGEAYAIGLANIVVPVAQLDAATADLSAAVLAGDRGAVAEIKALLAGAADRSYADSDRAEREAQTRRLREIAGLGE